MAFVSYTAKTVTVHSEVCGDLDIFTKIGGPQSAEPLVLLHGYPQSHYIWRSQAEELAKHYRVILLDLRGYGRSSKPKGNAETHVEYSKREMAKDVIQVAKHFGYNRFNLVAHDRGARVAHRLVLDHPEAVTKLMLLDICPTIFHFETTDMEFASKYWHWFFQLLPNAEDMIHANPQAYFKTATRQYVFSPEAHKDYFDAFSTYEGIHGSCEDYRAAATIDLKHDAESRKQNEKIQVPKIRILWGEEGLIPKYGDVVGVWQSFSAPTIKVTGRSMPSGHYISEQDPEGTLKEILDFLAD